MIHITDIFDLNQEYLDIINKNYNNYYIYVIQKKFFKIFNKYKKHIIHYSFDQLIKFFEGKLNSEDSFIFLLFQYIKNYNEIKTPLIQYSNQTIAIFNHIKDIFQKCIKNITNYYPNIKYGDDFNINIDLIINKIDKDFLSKTLPNQLDDHMFFFIYFNFI